MVSPGTPSFALDNYELDMVAHKLTDHADGLGTAIAPLNALPGSTPDELGEHAHEAYLAFFDAWKREADVITEAMRETGHKLDETVKHYCEIDALQAGIFGNIFQSTPDPWRGVPFK
jgi:hypothetical protein